MSGIHQIARARMLGNLSAGWGEHTNDQYHYNTEKFNKEYANTLRTQWESFDQLEKDQVVKLGMVMLVCAYYEDDGEISYMEKASLKNVIKHEGLHLSEQEKEELLAYQEQAVHVKDVLDYIERYKLKDIHVKQAFSLVNSIVVNETYKTIVNDIMNQYNQK